MSAVRPSHTPHRFSGRSLRGALPALARSLGRRANVQVVFGSGPPRTDGQYIVLPHLPLHASEKLVTMTLGCASHEIGHVRFTNFKPEGVSLEDLPQAELGLWNAIEDPRQEAKMCRVYLGVRKILGDYRKVQFEEGSVKTGMASPKEGLEMYALKLGWSIYGIYPSLEDRLATQREILVGWIGEELTAKVESILRAGYPNLETSDDALNLAREVLDLLRDEIEDEGEPGDQGDQPGPSGDSDDSDEGDSGESGDSGDGGQSSSNEDAEESNEEEDGSSGSTGDGGEGGDPSDGRSEGEESGENDPDDSDGGSGSGSDPDDEGDESGSGGASEEGEGSKDPDCSSDPSSQSGESSESGESQPQDGDGDSSEGEDGDSSDNGQSGQQSGQSSESGEQSSPSDGGDSAGSSPSPDSRRDDVAENIRRIFEEDDSSSGHTDQGDHEEMRRELERLAREETEKARGKGEPTTVDSTLEERIPDAAADALGRLRDVTPKAASRLARELKRLLVEALAPTHRTTRTGTRFARNRLHRIRTGDPRVFRRRETPPVELPACSFLVDLSGSMSGDKQDLASAGCLITCEALDAAGIPFEVFGFEGNSLWRAKGFEQPWQGAQARIGGLAEVSGGGTPWGAALFEVGSSLVRREERRKILFTAADGMPNDGAAVKDALERLSNDGVEVIGLDIMDGGVEDYIPNPGFINTPEEIAPAILGTIRRHVRFIK